MSSDTLFEKLLKEDTIKVATRFNVIVSLEIEKIKENCYSIDCLHNPPTFNLPVVLFQITSQQENGNVLSIDELKSALYEELDKIKKCTRCFKIHQTTDETSEVNCPTCELELDYIDSRKHFKKSHFHCGLCSNIYWSYFGRKASCCKGDILCMVCIEKVIEFGFCSYCRTPVNESDFI